MTQSSKPERRDHTFSVQLTETEKQKLEELAQQAHMSRAAYVRSVLFRKLPPIINRTPMDESWCLKILDKLSDIFVKQCSQESTLRESDMMTDDLEKKLSESVRDIHEVCIDLEEKMGV